MTAHNYIVSLASERLGGFVRSPESRLKNKRRPGILDCVSARAASPPDRVDRLTFQGKPRCFAAVKNFSFRLHNTLTCVSFILAPRLALISVATAAHWVTDEIKLLAEEIRLLCL